MRILTVRQPWAWAIIHGGKDVENRVRNIAGDYHGPIAIHAAKANDVGAWRALGRLNMFAYGAALDARESLIGGAIIGVVDLAESHPVETCIRQEHDGDWTVCSEWAERSGHHLVLANPRALDQPVPWKGALGLRRTNLDIIGDHLAERVDTCTCGQSGVWGPHEPACGYEPIARLVTP